jgi:hypothetical protein
MDPNGGINPSNPRLDTAAPQPGQPVMGQPMGVSPVTAPILETPIEANPMASPIAMADQQQAAMAGATPAAPKGGGGMAKKIILAIVGLIVLAGLVGAGYFVGFSAGKSKGRIAADAAYQAKEEQAQKSKSDTKDDKTTDDANTAELQLGDLIEPKYVDETLEGEIGKQVNSGDGFVLKVVNIERNYKTTDTNYKLDSTKELVKVNFLIGNITKDKPKDISSFNFRLENSANAQLTSENIAEYTDKFDTVKLEPGGQAKGSIVYAVNKDEVPLKFVREQRYRISSENREVTIRTIITIAK